MRVPTAITEALHVIYRAFRLNISFSLVIKFAFNKFSQQCGKHVRFSISSKPHFKFCTMTNQKYVNHAESDQVNVFFRFQRQRCSEKKADWLSWVDFHHHVSTKESLTKIATSNNVSLKQWPLAKRAACLKPPLPAHTR